MVGRGLHEIVGWSFTEPGAARPAAAARRPRDAPRRGAREPAVGRAVDHAPDAARLAARRRPAQRRAQRARRRHLRVGHRLPRAPAARGDRRAARDEHHALGALLSGALAPRSWRGERAAGRLLRRQGAARGDCSTASVFDWSVRSAELAVPAPRPQRRRAGARRAGSTRDARLPRRDPPARRRRLGPRAHRRVRDRPRQARRRRARGRLLPRRSAPSRRCARTSPSRCPSPCRRARCSHAVRTAAGRDARRRARSSTSTPASRWGRAGARSRSRSRSARSSARSPTRTSRPLRERIVAALAELGGELRG